MQFRDLKAQYDVLKEDIDRAIANVLDETNFISGKQVQELEKDLAEYVGVKHCITCANGTDALAIALKTWNIGVGDAVFVPDFTFFASGEVVSYAGATPIFVDVNKDTFNISAESLEKAIIRVLNEKQLRLGAIIAVDLFGMPADYLELRRIANKYGLLILEDAAQGFGGTIGGKRACSFGDISTTSFFPAKPLGCYGDGGAIFTDNDEHAEYIRSICVHGKGRSKYDNVRIGMNSRLDTIQAAILQVKFKAFKEYELIKVNEVAEIYTKFLDGIVITPVVPKGFYSSWAQYCIRLKNVESRDNLQKHLNRNRIPSMIYYSKPMHKQTAFSYLTYIDDDFTNSNELCDTVLEVPIHPYLKKEEIKLVIDIIIGYMDK